MSNQADSGGTSIREPYEVLGYLLKHAHLALEGFTDAALALFGITSRDLGALRVIAWRGKVAARRRRDSGDGPDVDGRTARRARACRDSRPPPF